MESIDIYESFDIERGRRIGRNVKVAYRLSRYGAKALSEMNPVGIYMDLAISTGEFAVSIFSYLKAKEHTEQLQIKLKTIQEIYKKQKNTYQVIYQDYRSEMEKNVTIVTENMALMRDEWENILAPIYKTSREYLKLVNEALLDLRATGAPSTKISELEKRYREALVAFLSISLKSI